MPFAKKKLPSSTLTAYFHASQQQPLIMKKILLSVISFVIISGVFAQDTAKRNLNPADIYRLQTLSDPQVSPEGKWVAYTLSSVDTALNKRNADIWMVSWDGKENVQLTSSADGESQPRWSPDGKYLAFVSSRQATANAQIWLMNRLGGEGKQLTSFKGELSAYSWSPDSKKLLLAIKFPADTTKPKTPKPIVLDRYHFKEDVEGYLLSNQHTHLYLFDIAGKKLDTLTTGNFDEGGAVFSPDGTKIAFVSNRTQDPDRNVNDDIYLIEPKAKAPVTKITTWQGTDNSPIWSPDSKQIAYLRSSSEQYSIYEQAVLAVVSAAGGTPKLLSDKLDRPVANIKFSTDGKTIIALISDDREHYVGQFEVESGAFTKIAGGKKSFAALQTKAVGEFATLVSEPQLPGELYALENGTLRRLTTHQNQFIAPLKLATAEGFTSTSSDGTKVSNLLYLPPNATTGKKLPAIFFIHGGPTAQDEYSFDLSRQMFAAAGYATVAVNYRGSNGRGLDFSTTISADWGNKEVKDIIGSVNYLIEKGIADSAKLGIGGWSYGGILTNYTIATDSRFKAASSGAGVSMMASLYGVDQYILQYDNELGVPWKNIDKYLALSYPFLHADRIKTPTQFMVGESDFNVPSVGSEQMYQALKSLNIPSELIIYPGQFHGISIPSYQKDRFERWLAWFAKYLK